MPDNATGTPPNAENQANVHSTVIHSARRITPTQIIPDAWVAWVGHTITEVGTGDSWHAVVAGRGDAPEASVIDAAGAYLSPGFIDIHNHGGAGRNFDDGQVSFDAALAMHRSHGTTRCIISLVTNPIEKMIELTGQAAARAEADELVLGVHLEGPFLNTSHKGAHSEELLHAATRAELDALLAAGRGQIRQITMAPELEGGLDSIRHLVSNGVAVAVGHSDADYETTVAAFEAGATILTHAFNGMNGIHHRAPGPVVAAIDTPGITLEVIADDIHVRPEVIAILFGQAPGRIALITDAMAAAGFGDGSYTLGSLDVTVTDGVARLNQGGSIAGSTLTLDRALQVAVNRAGLSITDAVTALTVTPATALGLGDTLGRTAPGYAADILLLSDALEVQRVWAAGVERLATA